MKKGDDYQPPPNRPFYSKETKSKMYSQIEKVVQNFNGMDTQISAFFYIVLGIYI